MKKTLSMLLSLLLTLALLCGTACATADGTEKTPAWQDSWEEIVVLRSDPATCLCRRQGGYSWTLTDADGRVLYDNALDAFYGFSDEGIAVIRRGAYYGYLGEDGTLIVEPSLSYASQFFDGLACVERNEKKGYMDVHGNMVVDFIFDYANDFQDGYACVGEQGSRSETDDSSGYTYTQRWGVIDTGGNIVLPIEYDSVSYNSADGMFTASSLDQEHLFYITDGKVTEVKQVLSDLSLAYYLPYSGAKVATLDESVALAWDTSANLPALDGATALFPVYSAFAQAGYMGAARYGEEESDPLITCTKTNRAYERLIEGSADIIFCAQPSDAQLKMAAEAGVELELTPFGKESFVFIVNQGNPIESITVEQIRQVYSGRLTQWDELGVPNLGEIIAYQRPENSGSQTALQRLMGDVPLMEAPSENVSYLMDDILEAVEYRNLPNALGYSFRFYCTEMIGSDVKLLAIDGVAPSVENIRNDTYPITSTLYAVTRRGESNPNVQVFLDWIASPQGQSLVERTGYVAWNG